MRSTSACLGLAGLGLAGLGLYAGQRQLLGRAFGLRPAEYPVAFEADLPARMPDGTTLYADRLYPRTPGPFPTILIRTPYGRPSELWRMGMVAAWLFAERGYNVVVQSVRGRFRSEGRFEPFINEASDGHATLAWLAEQAWFEGNLGMWGASYVGYTQWAVAADAPPYLKALVPITTTARFSHSFYPGGAFTYESTLRWSGYLQATDRPGRGIDLRAFAQVLSPRREAALRAAMSAAPFASADQAVLGAPQPAFQRWLAETAPDSAYWRNIDQHRKLGRVDAAVHLVAGWYDIFLPEQLDDYSDLLAAGRNPALTVLPRHHTDPRLRGDGIREGLWWFDAHLKGHRALLDRRAVRLLLTGAREQHVMDFWPPPAQAQQLYLQPAGRLGAEPPSAPSASHYRYEPRRPTPSLGGPVLSPAAGARDQRVLEARPDLLCFTGDVLADDLELVGYVRLELYARSSQAHTDFVGRLCDVAPDGRSVNVCEGLARVSPTQAAPEPDGSLHLSIYLGAAARRFRAGHRLRLHLCSAAHPRWSANSGDGRSLAAGAPDGPPAEQTILHDREHPSVLILPIVSAQTRRAMAGQRDLPPHS